MEEISNIENKAGSQIQEFYRNKSIFISGGTGFMGKVLIEKLLRSCPQISSVYLLVRSKKNKDCQQRIQEFLDDKVFHRLDQKTRLKIFAIPGDLSQPGLGIGEEHKKLLLESTEVVFHAAATVRFDESLPVAVSINVAGTKEMLELAHKMKNLKAYVHVSTAFSNCNLKEVEEKIYTAPMAHEKLIQLTECLETNVLDKVTQIILDKHPNTYVYTKCVAEDIVRTQSKGLPISIFRPSIVIGANEEPLPGWIDNLYGATGVIVGVGSGILRTIQCDADVIADVIPVDMAVNSLIASAWKTANRAIEDTNQNDQNKETDDYYPPVYNYVSSVEKPITWGDFLHLGKVHGMEVPLAQAIWCACVTLNKSWFLHRLYVFFLHFLPAFTADSIAPLFGKRTNMLAVYKKVNKFLDVLSYFSTRQWTFNNDNVQNLWKSLTPQDKKLFPFDMSSLDWDVYFYNYVRGIRSYLVKDDPSTIPYAKTRSRRFLFLHRTIKVLLGLVLLRILWAILIPLFI